MEEAPKERTVTIVTENVMKGESISDKDMLFSLFSKVTTDVDFLRPNLVYRFFYSVTENKDDPTHVSTHVLYMEKLDGIARTKEHGELLYGGRSIQFSSFRPNLIQLLLERALNQITNKGINTLLFKDRIYLVSEWLKNTQTDSFVITTDAVRKQEQPLEIAIYGFYGAPKYL